MQAEPRSTRQRILEAARELFNQKSYKAVTMREIAAHAGIAVGNLTYHFRRKEDIARALMDDEVDATLLSAPLTGVHRLHAVLSLILDTLTRNPFYFLDSDMAALVGPNDHLNSQRVQRQLYEATDALVADGLMTRAFQGAQQEAVLRVLLLSHITWLRDLICSGDDPAQAKQRFLALHWRVLSAYLTDAGLAQLKELYFGAK